jgi:hypothetical protein
MSHLQDKNDSEQFEVTHRNLIKRCKNLQDIEHWHSVRFR